ncbi:hypothetical protein F5Y16DRAFT_366979 [Xylariaceae sp. FL0255]|nr:hypothetical protein F5Y16DRAFT_366979 [Xylariaceae sp. FL0255]
MSSLPIIETSRPNEIVIDPDGDLRLKVGQPKCIIPLESSDDGCSDHSDLLSDSDDEDCDYHEHLLPIIYRVCSKTLSRASRVRKVLLYGGFSESRASCASGSDWIVELPDDDSGAMFLALNIIHSRFESIPRATDVIDIEKLYRITVLTDKYDLAHILRPWASTWMEHLRKKRHLQKKQKGPPIILDLERMLWISWELGDQSFFTSIARCIVRYSCANAAGDLQNNNGLEMTKLFSATLEPPGMYDLIKPARLSLISTLYTPFTDLFVSLLSKQSRCCKAEPQSSENWKCERTMLGNLTATLVEGDCWPSLTPATSEKSAYEICKELEKAETASLLPGDQHSDCIGMPDQKDRLTAACRDI